MVSKACNLSIHISLRTGRIQWYVKIIYALYHADLGDMILQGSAVLYPHTIGIQRAQVYWISQMEFISFLLLRNKIYILSYCILYKIALL